MRFAPGHLGPDVERASLGLVVHLYARVVPRHDVGRHYVRHHVRLLELRGR